MSNQLNPPSAGINRQNRPASINTDGQLAPTDGGPLRTSPPRTPLEVAIDKLSTNPTTQDLKSVDVNELSAHEMVAFARTIHRAIDTIIQRKRTGDERNPYIILQQMTGVFVTHANMAWNEYNTEGTSLPRQTRIKNYMEELFNTFVEKFNTFCQEAPDSTNSSRRSSLDQPRGAEASQSTSSPQETLYFTFMTPEEVGERSSQPGQFVFSVPLPAEHTAEHRQDVTVTLPQNPDTMNALQQNTAYAVEAGRLQAQYGFLNTEPPAPPTDTNFQNARDSLTKRS